MDNKKGKYVKLCKTFQGVRQTFDQASQGV